MLDVRYSTRFKKDFKACVKRRYNMSLLQQVVDTLRIPASLPPKNTDHNLSGNPNEKTGELLGANLTPTEDAEGYIQVVKVLAEAIQEDAVQDAWKWNPSE